MKNRLLEMKKEILSGLNANKLETIHAFKTLLLQHAFARTGQVVGWQKANLERNEGEQEHQVAGITAGGSNEMVVNGTALSQVVEVSVSRTDDPEILRADTSGASACVCVCKVINVHMYININICIQKDMYTKSNDATMNQTEGGFQHGRTDVLSPFGGHSWQDFLLPELEEKIPVNLWVPPQPL